MKLDAGAVADALEAWFSRCARALPWRSAAPDPYRVWVSEVMLQQTRVETVVGRYAAFLERFPDLGALAAADEDAVLKAWEGLGYYRRARQLHACARVLVAAGVPTLPSEPDALRALPGFGPYMAGAVASIAFGRRVPATDANAVRVFSRLGALESARGSAALLRDATALHAEVVAHCGRSGALNQAVMDLGATVCGRRPRCEDCPVHRHCAAFARGGGAAARAYPRAAAPRHRAERSVAMAVLSDGSGGVLAERRPPGLLGGLWGLPMTEVEGTGGHDEQAALRRLEERLGAVPGSLERMAGFAWAFTHRTWRVGVYRGSCPAAATSPHGAWLDPVDRQAAAFGGPFRRALALAASWPDGPASRRSASPGPSA